MALKVKYPIWIKLLLLMSFVVMTAIGTYLALAIKLFQDDKTSLVYELNVSNVRSIGAQVQSELKKTIDKVKLLTQGYDERAWTQAVFEAEPDIVTYTLYRPGSNKSWKQVKQIRNSQYLKLYGLNAKEIKNIRQQVPVPFNDLLSKGLWITNSTLPGKAPILTVGLLIEIKQKNLPHIAVVDVRMDRILRLLKEQGIATVYVLGNQGQVIAHSNPQEVRANHSLGDIPIVQDAFNSPLALQMKKFTFAGIPWLGAYSDVGLGGLKVVSQVKESEVLRAAKKLMLKSGLLALTLITATLMLTLLISKSFTNPLKKLLAATERIAKWDFGETVHVKSNDEIASLARAFNAMSSDLQSQRSQIEGNRAELERQVKERTAALEEEKKKAAEAQDSLVRTTRLASLGELAGVTAHEVLNPVNNMNLRIQRMKYQHLEAEEEDARLMGEIITGWKKTYQEKGWDGLREDLQKKVDNDKELIEEDLHNLTGIVKDTVNRITEKKADFEFLDTEVNRVSKIVNNMRSLARVGGERREVDIHEPLDSTFSTLTEMFKTNSVALVKDYSSDSRDLFGVVADKDELVQVFSNLMKNALQAITMASRRAGEVRVATKRTDERIEVRIKDNGLGIKSEHLGKLFEPDFTTKPADQGTGLGLSISRRLIRAFDGDIEVEATKEGEGTTFLVWFPVDKKAEAS